MLCGKSGCGKSTLLRCLKPIIKPYGKTLGDIIFENEKLEKLSERQQAEKIGFVMQTRTSDSNGQSLARIGFWFGEPWVFHRRNTVKSNGNG